MLKLDSGDKGGVDNAGGVCLLLVRLLRGPGEVGDGEGELALVELKLSGAGRGFFAFAELSM